MSRAQPFAFFGKRLRGEYSLPRSYWLHLVALQAVFAAVASALVAWMADHAHECSSACTIAFLGGKVRSAAPAAKLGFHTFKTVGGDDRSIAREVRSVYGEFGLSQAFISKIVTTSYATMWYPQAEELLAEHVLTERPGFGHDSVTSGPISRL